MTSRRKAVIFDLYGTLAEAIIDEDSFGFWDAFAAELAALKCRLTGYELKKSYHELIQEEAKAKEEGFLLDGVFQGLLLRCGVVPSSEKIEAVGEAFRKRSLIELRKKPYTDMVLTKLRQSGYRMALLSNTEALVSRYDQKKLGLEGSFDSVILSSTFGVKKPDPGIFRAMLESLAIAGDEAVFIGDTWKDDIEGCVGAGIDGVFLTAGDPRTRSDLESRYGGHVICSGFSASEILSALQQFGYSLPL